MNCRFCGAELDPKYPACSVCGTLLSKEECLALTGKERILEAEEIAEKKRKNRIITIVTIVISIAIIAFGGYHMLYNYINPEKPEMTFTSGYGIINGDEPVVYVTIGENEKLEYIHGAKLYAYNKGDDDSIGDALTSDYEYTKSVDDSFRTIFFDASKFDVQTNENYTYTIEMSFSFVDNSKIYVYQKTVDFPGAISGDASDIVFDHSMDAANLEETTTEIVTVPSTEPTTKPIETTATDISFLYSSYWFMTPYTNNGDYNISSVKFEQNGKCSFTNFFKKNKGDWTQSKSNGTYEVKNDTLYITDSEGMTDSFKIDFANKKVTGLESRKYNSTKNAEDFFGI